MRDRVLVPSTGWVTDEQGGTVKPGKWELVCRYGVILVSVRFRMKAKGNGKMLRPLNCQRLCSLRDDDEYAHLVPVMSFDVRCCWKANAPREIKYCYEMERNRERCGNMSLHRRKAFKIKTMITLVMPSSLVSSFSFFFAFECSISLSRELCLKKFYEFKLKLMRWLRLKQLYILQLYKWVLWFVTSALCL